MFSFLSNDYRYSSFLVIVVFLLSGLQFYKFYYEKPNYNYYLQVYFIILYGIYFWAGSMLFLSLAFNSLSGNIYIWFAGIPLIILIILFYKDKDMEILKENPLQLKDGYEIQQYLRSFMVLYENRLKNSKDFLKLQGVIIHHEKTCELIDCPLRKYLYLFTKASSKNFYFNESDHNDNNQQNSNKTIINAYASIFNKQIHSSHHHTTIVNPQGVEEIEEYDSLSDFENETGDLIIEFFNIIYSISVAKYPNCTSLRIKYALFLLERMNNKNLSLIELNMCSKYNPPIDQKFIIFRYKKIINEGINQNFFNESIDIVSEIAYDSHFKLFSLNIEKSSQMYLDFWELLLNDKISVDIEKLNELGSKINQCYVNIENHWMAMQMIKPNMPLALNLYSNYLLNVLNNKQKGEELFELNKEYINDKTNILQIFNIEIEENLMQFIKAGNGMVICSYDSNDKFDTSSGIIYKSNVFISKTFGYLEEELHLKHLDFLFLELYKDYLHTYIKTKINHQVQLQRKTKHLNQAIADKDYNLNQTSLMNNFDLFMGKTKNNRSIPVFINIISMNNIINSKNTFMCIFNNDISGIDIKNFTLKAYFLINHELRLISEQLSCESDELMKILNRKYKESMFIYEIFPEILKINSSYHYENIITENTLDVSRVMSFKNSINLTQGFKQVHNKSPTIMTNNNNNNKSNTNNLYNSHNNVGSFVSPIKSRLSSKDKISISNKLNTKNDHAVSFSNNLNSLFKPEEINLHKNESNNMISPNLEIGLRKSNNSYVQKHKELNLGPFNKNSRIKVIAPNDEYVRRRTSGKYLKNLTSKSKSNNNNYNSNISHLSQVNVHNNNINIANQNQGYNFYSHISNNANNNDNLFKRTFTKLKHKFKTSNTKVNTHAFMKSKENLNFEIREGQINNAKSNPDTASLTKNFNSNSGDKSITASNHTSNENLIHINNKANNKSSHNIKVNNQKIKEIRTILYECNEDINSTNIYNHSIGNNINNAYDNNYSNTNNSPFQSGNLSKHKNDNNKKGYNISINKTNNDVSLDNYSPSNTQTTPISPNNKNNMSYNSNHINHESNNSVDVSSYRGKREYRRTNTKTGNYLRDLEEYTILHVNSEPINIFIRKFLNINDNPINIDYNNYNNDLLGYKKKVISDIEKRNNLKLEKIASPEMLFDLSYPSECVIIKLFDEKTQNIKERHHVNNHINTFISSKPTSNHLNSINNSSIKKDHHTSSKPIKKDSHNFNNRQRNSSNSNIKMHNAVQQNNFNRNKSPNQHHHIHNDHKYFCFHISLNYKQPFSQNLIRIDIERPKNKLFFDPVNFISIAKRSYYEVNNFNQNYNKVTINGKSLFIESFVVESEGASLKENYYDLQKGLLGYSIDLDVYEKNNNDSDNDDEDSNSDKSFSSSSSSGSDSSSSDDALVKNNSSSSEKKTINNIEDDLDNKELVLKERNESDRDSKINNSPTRIFHTKTIVNYINKNKVQSENRLDKKVPKKTKFVLNKNNKNAVNIEDTDNTNEGLLNFLNHRRKTSTFCVEEINKEKSNAYEVQKDVDKRESNKSKKSYLSIPKEIKDTNKQDKDDINGKIRKVVRNLSRNSIGVKKSNDALTNNPSNIELKIKDSDKSKTNSIKSITDKIAKNRKNTNKTNAENKDKPESLLNSNLENKNHKNNSKTINNIDKKDKTPKASLFQDIQQAIMFHRNSSNSQKGNFISKRSKEHRNSKVSNHNKNMSRPSLSQNNKSALNILEQANIINLSSDEVFKRINNIEDFSYKVDLMYLFKNINTEKYEFKEQSSDLIKPMIEETAQDIHLFHLQLKRKYTDSSNNINSKLGNMTISNTKYSFTKSKSFILMSISCYIIIIFLIGFSIFENYNFNTCINKFSSVFDFSHKITLCINMFKTIEIGIKNSVLRNYFNSTYIGEINNYFDSSNIPYVHNTISDAFKNFTSLDKNILPNDLRDYLAAQNIEFSDVIWLDDLEVIGYSKTLSSVLGSSSGITGIESDYKDFNVNINRYYLKTQLLNYFSAFKRHSGNLLYLTSLNEDEFVITEKLINQYFYNNNNDFYIKSLKISKEFFKNSIIHLKQIKTNQIIFFIIIMPINLLSYFILINLLNNVEKGRRKILFSFYKIPKYYIKWLSELCSSFLYKIQKINTNNNENNKQIGSYYNSVEEDILNLDLEEIKQRHEMEFSAIPNRRLNNFNKMKIIKMKYFNIRVVTLLFFSFIYFLFIFIYSLIIEYKVINIANFSEQISYVAPNITMTFVLMQDFETIPNSMPSDISNYQIKKYFYDKYGALNNTEVADDQVYYALQKGISLFLDETLLTWNNLYTEFMEYEHFFNKDTNVLLKNLVFQSIETNFKNDILTFLDEKTIYSNDVDYNNAFIKSEYKNFNSFLLNKLSKDYQMTTYNFNRVFNNVFFDMYFNFQYINQGYDYLIDKCKKKEFFDHRLDFYPNKYNNASDYYVDMINRQNEMKTAIVFVLQPILRKMNDVILEYTVNEVDTAKNVKNIVMYIYIVFQVFTFLIVWLNYEYKLKDEVSSIDIFIYYLLC